MHRARRISVVGEAAAVGQLKGTGRQGSHVRNPSIRSMARQSSAAAEEIWIISRVQSVLRRKPWRLPPAELGADRWETWIWAD
jgi:hypothetical protein